MMSSSRERKTEPRPFLKWVGGKGQLLEPLHAEVMRAGAFRRYHEPFVGGGALFFCLYRSGLLNRYKARLSDANGRLIETYRGVQQDVEGLIALLAAHQRQHGKEHYYATRDAVPEDAVARAARIIYLNKTCFNGLYRENSRGLFNVPMGKYKNPLICDEANLRAVSAALRRAQLSQSSFEAVLDAARPEDLVYFDPPYQPVSLTSSFTSYHESGFGEAAQRELARVAAGLDRKGVRFILSNSDAPLIHELYGKFKISTVLASRTINSRSDRRGKIKEVLVCNY